MIEEKSLVYKMETDVDYNMEGQCTNVRNKTKKFS